MHEIDINKEPPSREFLEKHIDRGALPRFRQHAQPGVQGAAAAEVEEGSDRSDDGEPEPDPPADHDQGVDRCIFGFDKDDRYGRKARRAGGPRSARRAGTTRRARAPGTASSIRRRARRPKGFDELAFYAEHFDTVEVNSTFYGQPRAEVMPRLGRAHAGGLRILGQALSEVHAPADVQRARREADLPDDRGRRRRRRRCIDALARPNDADLDEFRRGIDPLAVARQARRAARAVSAELQGRAGVARLPRRSCCARFADYPVAVELRHRSWSDALGETLALLNEFRRRVGADRRAEVPLLDPAELPAERRGLLLHAAARPERRASGGGTRSRKTATTTCTRPTS